MRWAALLLLTALVSAAPGCRTPRFQQRCRFGPERLVAKGTGSLIRAVSFARRGEDLLAAWTDRSGTLVVRIDEEGRRLGRPRRVGPPSDSLDLVATARGYTIAMLKTGHLLWGGGGAFRAELDADGALLGEPAKLGRAGHYSRGIAVGLARGGAVVTWHDGTPGMPVVMLSPPSGPVEQLSGSGFSGCCPSLVEGSSSLIALWGQFQADRDGSQVVMQPLAPSGQASGASRVIARAAITEPWPVARGDAEGFGLAYRDRRDYDTRDQLVFQRFTLRGDAVTRPSRLGRYDGRTKAVLLRAGARWSTLAVRTWSKQRILAYDRFDSAGERIGAELHVFDIRVQFADADALRLGDRYLVLYAEDEPQQRLWLSEIRCW